jgi:hypothetical protein
MLKFSIISVMLLAGSEVATCVSLHHRQPGALAKEPSTPKELADMMLQGQIPGLPTAAEFQHMVATQNQLKQDPEHFPPKPLGPNKDLQFVARGELHQTVPVLSMKVHLLDINLFVRNTSALWDSHVTKKKLLKKAPGDAALVYHFFTRVIKEGTKIMADASVANMMTLGCEDQHAANEFGTMWEKYADTTKHKALTLYLDADGVRAESKGKQVAHIESNKIAKCVLLQYLHDNSQVPDVHKAWIEGLSKGHPQ